MKILCYGIYRDKTIRRSVYLKYECIDLKDHGIQYLKFTECKNIEYLKPFKASEVVKGSFCFIEKCLEVPKDAKFSYEKNPFECDLSYVEDEEDTCLYSVMYSGYELEIGKIRVGFLGNEYYEEGNSYFITFIDSHLIYSFLNIHPDYVEELSENDVDLTAK